MSFKFGTQISSDASSDENSGCEGSSVQGLEEALNDTSLASGQDEEQERCFFWKHKERGKRSTLLHTRFCVRLQTVLALYEQENIRSNKQPRHSRLKTSVTRHVDQMVRTRNFKARNERIGTGAVTKSQKGTKVSVEREVGECSQ